MGNETSLISRHDFILNSEKKVLENCQIGHFPVSICDLYQNTEKEKNLHYKIFVYRSVVSKQMKEIKRIYKHIAQGKELGKPIQTSLKHKHTEMHLL